MIKVKKLLFPVLALIASLCFVKISEIIRFGMIWVLATAMIALIVGLLLSDYRIGFITGFLMIIFPIIVFGYPNYSVSGPDILYYFVAIPILASGFGIIGSGGAFIKNKPLRGIILLLIGSLVILAGAFLCMYITT